MTETLVAEVGALDSNLAEVWGDVVSRSQLGKAIMVGVALSVATYLSGLGTFAPLASSGSVAKAFAMLAGIAGAVSAGAICSITFQPKRVLVLGPASAVAWQFSVLQQLKQDEGTLGSLDDLGSDVVEEMRAVGLYDVFKSFEDISQVGSRSVA